MGWWAKLSNTIRDLFALNKSIQETFGVKIAISSTMQNKQDEWRRLVAGASGWNDKDTPSLLLADTISSEIASRAALGLKCEVTGSPRADFINEQIKPEIDTLQYTVQAVCNNGEAIYKPYSNNDKIKVTLVETDSYWAVGYNTEQELIDVIFGAVYQTDKFIYRLLERHKYDSQAKTHTIEYRAFKAVHDGLTFTPENLGKRVELSEVPDWANLYDMTINGLDKPLFVVIKAPPTKQYEKPQRQGVPIWSKAADAGLFRKADKHEARTEWEFEGGELAIHADDSMFKRNKSGNLVLPKGKERLYRGVQGGGADDTKPLDVFNPEPRIETYKIRKNELRRDIELSCGLSYGILSDNNLVEKTAQEFKASKERLITTISGMQIDTMQPALEHLIESYNVLADLQGIPQGNCENKFEWSESYALEREDEVNERLKLQSAGVLFPDEVRAFYNEVELEVAQQDFADRGIPLVATPTEF